MGFFGFIGSCISGVCSAVGSFVSGACSVFTKAVAGIAGIATGALSVVLGPLGPILGPIITNLIIKVIGAVLSKLAKLLHITKEEENPEEVGYRVDEASRHEDWKKREEFASFRDYYDYLRQQIPDEEIDQDKLNKNSGAYRIIGSSTLYHEIGEEEGMDLPGEFMMDIGRGKLSAEEVKTILKTFKDLKVDGKDISDYWEGNMTFREEKPITEALRGAFAALYPEKSKEEINDRLDDIRSATRGTIDNGDSLETLKRLYKDEISQMEQERADIAKSGDSNALREFDRVK